MMFAIMIMPIVMMKDIDDDSDNKDIDDNNNDNRVDGDSCC